MSLDKIIVALDVETKEQAINIIKKIGDRISFYKIGSILFTNYGPSLVDEVKNFGKKVFLDLKYYDIPNTVSNAIISAINHKVDMLTIHASGGYKMIKEAVDATNKAPYKLDLLGVTVLTSMKTSDIKEVGVNRKVASHVKKLAILANHAGLNGFVCSSKEINIIRKISKNATIVVPGIRFNDDNMGDQQRVATPKEAISQGASYLVIGRTIISSFDLQKTLDRIEDDIN